jgi:hypothetical protein
MVTWLRLGHRVTPHPPADRFSEAEAAGGTKVAALGV